MQICCVCGARPNFMKIAAVIRAFEPHAALQPFLVHTGQHYDEKMCRILFDDLGLPKPDVNLEVGSASHAVQTAEIMKRFEPVFLERKPDLVVVVGDVNSTVACALDAVKLGVPVAHVEAGLNRIVGLDPGRIREELKRVINGIQPTSTPPRHWDGKAVQRIAEILLECEANGIPRRK